VVCASQLLRRGWVTLLELLQFYAENYVHLAKELYDLQLCLYADELSGDQAKKQDTLSGAKLTLVSAAKHCDALGLQVSLRHVYELIEDAKEGGLLSGDVKALHQNIERELSCRFFVGIPEDRKSAYCESLKGWEDIIEKFPSATEDVEEMNKCLALCRYSAAVFHSLLIVEHGLVALGQMLGVTDPKEGWDASCRKLETVVKAGRATNSTGINFEFLEQLNGCVQAMKFAWRNKVNHATGKPLVMAGGFAPYVAEEIISTTRGFMRRLAEELPKPSLPVLPKFYGQ
jgi:hypothetical protein